MAHPGDVLARIEDFTVGGPDGHPAFLAQLAEQDGWSLDTAVRAWREYLRFLALASTSPDQPRVPSPAVDAVWHLHLAHADSYERELQPLLGGVLGHQQDGSAQNEQYRETIAAYAASFGPPPRDLWPRPAAAPAPPVRRRRRWIALPYLAAVIALVVLLGIGHPVTLVVLAVGIGVWLWRQVQRERSGPLATPAPSKEPACQSSWNGSAPFS